MKDSVVSKNKNKQSFSSNTREARSSLRSDKQSLGSGDPQKVRDSRFPLLKKRSLYLFISLFLFNLILIYSIFILLNKIEENSFRDYSYKSVSTQNFPTFVPSDELNVSSPSFIVFDPVEKVLITGRNSDFKFPPASSAKIMTALVALESFPPDQVLVATNPEFVIGSRMGLVNGEKIRVIDLLYGLLLPSGNDAAFTFAQSYQGGISQFVARMNTKAQELRLKDTYFVDPAGLEDSNSSTAEDLAKLAAYALTNDTISHIVNTKIAVVSATNIPINHSLGNLNELLGVDGVNGVKTGFTEEAGGVLVTSLNREGKKYIIVVLKSFDRFSDTRELINKVVKNVKVVNL